MSSEASNEQSCIHKGAGYDEVYPSGQDDFGTSYDEMVLSTNSPSAEEDKDSNVDESQSGSSGDSKNESPIRFVTGPNGLRQFLVPLMWTVNEFNSIIKRPYFETLRERYQIPTNVPINLPLKFEKCYY